LSKLLALVVYVWSFAALERLKDLNNCVVKVYSRINRNICLLLFHRFSARKKRCHTSHKIPKETRFRRFTLSHHYLRFRRPRRRINISRRQLDPHTFRRLLTLTPRHNIPIRTLIPLHLRPLTLPQRTSRHPFLLEREGLVGWCSHGYFDVVLVVFGLGEVWFAFEHFRPLWLHVLETARRIVLGLRILD